jgi:YHS domain-containing protein
MLAMKAFVRGVVFGGCLLAGWCSQAAAADQISWCVDFRTACGLAAEQHRLVLLHFSKDPCEPCRKVENQVFSQPQVGEAVAQNYVPVHVDAAKDPQLVSRYQIKMFPTDVIVTPSGLEVYRAISPQKPAEYIALLSQVAQQTGTATQRQWSANMDKLAQQATSGVAAAQKAVNGAANSAQQSAAAAQGTAGQFAAGVQSQMSQGQRQLNQAVQAFGAAADQAESTATATAQQAAATGRDYQQQVVGAAEELHQQSAQEWQKTSQAWQQSLTSVRSDLRSAFVSPGGNPASSAASPAAAAPPTVPPTSSTLTTNAAPPFEGPPAAAAPASVAPSAPVLPTENPWLTAAGKALNVPQPKPQLSPAPQQQAAAPAPAPAAPAPAAPPAPGAPAFTGPTVAASQAPPVAMDGFCVVSLIEKLAWKKADPKYGAIHRGRTYLFVSEDAQKKFLQNPDAFAPALSGCDPVRFARTGELVPGKRAYGLLTPDKRIYLFADEQSLQVFEKAPGEYAEMARQALLRGETGRVYR